jgi:hypothetical protein
VPYIEHKVELDYLAFEPKGVYKHGLTYTSISCNKNRRIVYLLQPLEIKNFQVDPSVAIGMYRLQSLAHQNVLIKRPHTLRNCQVLIFILTLDHCLCIRMMFSWIAFFKHFIYYSLMKHISIHKHHIFCLSLIQQTI